MSNPENVLVVGNGGREHALAWKLAQSPLVGNVFVAPGNGGTESVGRNVDIAADDVDTLLQFANDNHIGLTVVGPETALANGLVDAFAGDNLPVFGPTREAAKLETDKSWAMAFMARHGIPHPASVSFVDPDAASAYLESVRASSVVIKASGLAGGKGVVLPETKVEAQRAVADMMTRRVYGEAGAEILIQERLSGPEVSILAITDGTTVVPLLPAADHKRIFDNDRGPNTGGMGVFAPVPSVTPRLMQEICTDILQPTVNGMREEGVPYKGVLYAGIMLTKFGPKVLEFNARFGDPETQPLMMLLQSDLAPVLFKSIRGTLSRGDVRFRKGAAVCVIAASDGYPGAYTKGKTIEGFPLEKRGDVEVFHARTRRVEGGLITDGGRVLGVTARGMSLKVAIYLAYDTMNRIHFDGMQYRRDIGQKGLEADA